MEIIDSFLDKGAYTKFDKMEDDFCAYCGRDYAFMEGVTINSYIEQHTDRCPVVKARALIAAVKGGE